MYTLLFLVVGCGFVALSAVMFRITAAERKRIRGSVRVTGEVIALIRGVKDTARIRFAFQHRVHEVSFSAASRKTGRSTYGTTWETESACVCRLTARKKPSQWMRSEICLASLRQSVLWG